MGADGALDHAIGLALRGVVDCVREEELKQRLQQSAREGVPLRVKLGLDPTAPDVHLGHAVVLRKLRQFQDLGHEAILLLGGATAVLGDPTGKDKMRPRLTESQVAANAQTYLDQAGHVLNLERLKVANNADWYQKFGFQQFIELGARSTVAQMIERDLFQRRLQDGNPIGIHEFLYPLLQGWDSVELNADIELGGSDQLFNLLMGRDLQSQVGQRPQVCLTMPLLVGLDGTQKMSKSLGNYIGLTFEAEEIFGKVMSIPDELMENYFLLLTDLTEDEIQKQLALHPREAKANLGERLASWLRGEDAGRAAREHFDRVFKERQVPKDIPEVMIPTSDTVDGGIGIVALLVKVGFAKSNSEARRLIQGKGIRVDGTVVEHLETEVDVRAEPMLQAGKRRFVRVVCKRNGDD